MNVAVGSGIRIGRIRWMSEFSPIAAVRMRRSIVQKGLNAAVRFEGEAFRRVDVGSADEAAVRAKSQLSGLTPIAAIGARSKKCHKAT